MKKLMISSFCFLLLIIACNNEESFVKNETFEKDALSDNRFYGVKYAGDDILTKGIAQRNKLWYPGSVITVKFLNGSIEYRETVMNYATEWEDYAGVTFEFITEGKADVRIGFDWNQERYITWSYTGTDCKWVNNQSEATASFADWQRASEEEKKGDVLRVFGQVLGLELEHRHLKFEADWSDRIADYWEGEITDIPWEDLKEYVFDPLLSDRVIMTDSYDENSIMIWPFPRRYAGNTPRDFNSELSDTDKQFIAQLYPKVEEEPVIVVEANIDEAFPWVDITLYSDNPFSVKVDYGDGNKKIICSTYNYTNNHSLPVYKIYARDKDNYSIKNIKIYADEGEIKSFDSALPNIKNLDVTKCKTLEYLQLQKTILEKPLDLSKNPHLKEISLFCIEMPSLKLPLGLETFWSTGILIPPLDITECRNLKKFYCVGTKLGHIDLRNNLLLEEVYISYNEKTTILFPENSNLKELGYSNIYTDLSHLKELTVLSNGSYPYEYIDLSNNIHLEELQLSGSKILSLNVSIHKNINYIELTGAAIVDNEDAMIDFANSLPDRSAFDIKGVVFCDIVGNFENKIESICESKNWQLVNYPRTMPE